MLAEYLECPMETLLYSRMNSPVGPLLMGLSGSALVVLAFDRGLPDRHAGKPVGWRESLNETKAVRTQLEEYFAGKRRDFSIPLDLRGTDFQKQCWEELLRIPYGETRSYAEIARAVGRPNAYRAVGQANHLQSDRNRGSLPPRARSRNDAGRLRRWASDESFSVAARGR